MSYAYRTIDTVGKTIPHFLQELNQPTFLRKKGTFVLISLLLLSPIILYTAGILSDDEEVRNSPRNLILMISDGAGLASFTGTREYLQEKSGQSLFIDKFFVGLSKTASSSSLVTDSAAGATAISCGLKTFNGAIGGTNSYFYSLVDPSAASCPSLFEHTQRRVAIVVRSTVTHATPASFYAHVNNRNKEAEIALQLIESDTVDLVIGGGECHFKPKSLNGCRSDERNLLSEAQEKGWTVFHDLQDLKNLSKSIQESRHLNGEIPTVEAPKKVLILLSELHMPFEIDAKDSDFNGQDLLKKPHIFSVKNQKTYPRLREMVESALHFLKLTGEDFLMLVEGSEPDFAAHMNDPVALFTELVEYDKAFEVAQKFCRYSDTLLLSLSDHESGGLTLGSGDVEKSGEYHWSPGKLLKLKNSISFSAHKIYSNDFNEISLRNFFEEAEIEVSKEQVKLLLNSQSFSEFYKLLAALISSISGIGWTTSGHTGVDVGLYEYHRELQSHFNGVHENSEVGVKLRELFAK